MDLTLHIEQRCPIHNDLCSPHPHTADAFQRPHQLYDQCLRDTPRLFPTTDGFRSLEPHSVDLTRDSHRLPNEPTYALTQHAFSDRSHGGPPIHYAATIWDSTNAFVTQSQSRSYAMGHSSLVNENQHPTGILLDQPQSDDPSYPGNSAKSAQPDRINKSETTLREEQARALQQQIPRDLVPQVSFRSTRRQAQFTNSNVIRFIVNGKEGIRLSDVLEGNWVGLEGRDDRSLFGDRPDRLQILVRLQPIGCPPWISKICTTDFTARRRPIMKTKLATEVAKSVQRFIAREKSNGHGAGHDTQCGWVDISLKNLFLTRMVRASVASWQPEIFMEQQSTTTVPTQS